MELTAMENTAWLTIYCRYLESKKGNSILHDPFSEWFIEQNGKPAFAKSIQKRVFVGVPVRSVCFDDIIKEEIEKAKSDNYRVDSWILGCGFDSRWERFNNELGKTIREYCEFDFENLLEYKKAVISDSPFKELYSKVRRFGGDFLQNLPESIPDTDMPTLITLEGVMMYLNKEKQIKLLESIKERVPKAVVFADLYSALSVRMSNKKSEKSTGNPNVKFAWGPNNIDEFFAQQDWEVKRSISLIDEIFRKRNVFLGMLPFPRKILDGYKLVKIVPVVGRGLSPPERRSYRDKLL